MSVCIEQEMVFTRGVGGAMAAACAYDFVAGEVASTDRRAWG